MSHHHFGIIGSQLSAPANVGLDREPTGIEHTSSDRIRGPLVRVGHRAWAGNIGGDQLRNLKTSLLDDFVDLPIQVATAADALPERCEAILPHNDGGVGRAAMFYKDELPTGLQDALHFPERHLRV